MINNDTDIYNALAPYYRDYSEKKSAYLHAIDEYIISHIPKGATSMLDAGAGDGARGMKLAKEKNIDNIVLCDPSSEMANICKKLNPSEVWNFPIENLPENDVRFDVIICLWNVLGHLTDSKPRIKALITMKQFLSDKGVLFLDVNNRHNAAAYGGLKVFGRMVIDFIKPDEKRGDTSFDWKIGECSFPAMGHLFTPKEIEGLIRESGLNIMQKVAVNYSDGKLSSSPRRGQLLYMINKGQTN